jgi:hypothetical protein
VGTRLGKVLENEEFWESVLHFFVNHPCLDLAQVGPVVDFLQHQRFEWKEGVSPDGVFGKQEMKFVTTDNMFGIDPADANGKDDVQVLNDPLIAQE